VLIATFAALALLAPTGDTTVSVRRGDRLEADNHTGNITVRTWSQSAVMLRVRGRQGGVSIDRSGSTVSVELNWEDGHSGKLDYELTVPAWMPLELNGIDSDIAITGSRASISAETVSGSITLEGGSGNIHLESVEGPITVTGAQGRMELESVNAGITVRSSTGDVYAESVNGAVLIDADARRVQAETVNGDITFGGPIRDGGSYSLTTHNGNVMLGVQEGANALVSISTYQGELQAAFPVSVRGTREGSFSFTIGGGSASIEIESFQGTIRLVRPGAVRSR
jgi:DUF4097 and DUF4098 domain-containing protein YvlB